MSGEKTHDLHHQRRARNIAVLVLIVGMAVVLFAVTIVKLGNQATNPFAEQFNPQIEYIQERQREQSATGRE